MKEKRVELSGTASLKKLTYKIQEEVTRSTTGEKYFLGKETSMRKSPEVGEEVCLCIGTGWREKCSVRKETLDLGSEGRTSGRKICSKGTFPHRPHRISIARALLKIRLLFRVKKCNIL